MAGAGAKGARCWGDISPVRRSDGKSARVEVTDGDGGGRKPGLCRVAAAEVGIRGWLMLRGVVVTRPGVDDDVRLRS